MIEIFYKYRWLIGCLLAFILGLLAYGCSLQRILSDISMLKFQKKALQIELLQLHSALERNERAASLYSKQEPWVQVLIKLAYAHGLQTNNLIIKPKNNFSLEVGGSYQNLFDFIIDIYKTPVEVNHFLLKNKKTNLHLLLIGQYLAEQINFPQLVYHSYLYNPFCKINDFAGLSDTSKNIFPINLFRLIGYVRGDNIIEAILQLPNGHLFHAKEGDVLALEHVIVLKVTEASMLILLPNQKLIKLKREN